MTREELIHELDRIIDVGIVNAKNDTDVLRHIRKRLKREAWKPADQPPKDARYVMVTVLNESHEREIRIGQYISRWFTSIFVMNDFRYSPKVIAWRELPDFPEGEITDE